MMKMKFATLSLAVALAGCGSGGGDASSANALARCAACHSFEKDGARRTGPNLHGIVGTVAGAHAGYTSSTAMKSSGIVWSAETLDAFLAQPSKMIPGNRMAFSGETDPAKRKAIVEQLIAKTK